MLPAEAREAYLDGLPPEEQATVVRKAETLGPARDDADWLVVYESRRAADRIEIAAETMARVLDEFRPTVQVLIDHDAVARLIVETVHASLISSTQASVKNVARKAMPWRTNAAAMVLGAILASIMITLALFAAYTYGETHHLTAAVHGRHV